LGEFWGVFLGGFLRAAGPGAGIRECDGRGENVKIGKRGFSLFFSFLRFFSLFWRQFSREKNGTVFTAAGHGSGPRPEPHPGQGVRSPARENARHRRVNSERGGRPSIGGTADGNGNPQMTQMDAEKKRDGGRQRRGTGVTSK
jgi:hypothetical protein